MYREVVSIVIPVYNAEKYLDRCLQSVVMQTYKNLEIILLDDNSQDDSLEICLDWKKKDERIIVVSKKNETQGPTRNLGVKIASGKYLMFVDADDYVEPDYVELLYNSINENNSDMAFCDLVKDETLEDGSLNKMIRRSRVNIENFVYIKDMPSIISSMSFSLCDKIYRMDFWRKANINQKKNTVEDACLIFELLLDNVKISQVNKVLYHYCQNLSSEVHSMGYLEKLKNCVIDMYNISKKMFEDEIVYYHLKYCVARIVAVGEYSDNRCIENKQELFDLFNKLFLPYKDRAGMKSVVLGSYSLRSAVREFTYFMPDSYSFSSIISVMSKAGRGIDFTHKNGFRYDALNKDIYKKFIEKINEYQYLYIDFMEERYDIVQLDDDCFITASDAYEEGNIQGIDGHKIIYNGTDEYWELWKRACDALIKQIKNASNIKKVILVKTRLSEWYGEFGPEEQFKEYEEIQKYNSMFEKMENYFIDNFNDTVMIDFINDDFYTDASFPYGCYPWHINWVWYRHMGNQIYSKLQNL